jgi:hypothetical protein
MLIDRETSSKDLAPKSGVGNMNLLNNLRRPVIKELIYVPNLPCRKVGDLRRNTTI